MDTKSDQIYPVEIGNIVRVLKKIFFQNFKSEHITVKE